MVVVGSYDHTVYCLHATTGEVRWRHTTGDGVYAAPAIWDDGATVWVYATSSDRVLYALDADTGSHRWAHTVETFRPSLGGARLSSPAVGRVKHRNPDASLADSR